MDSSDSAASSTPQSGSVGQKLVRSTAFIPDVAPEGFWFWLPILWQRSKQTGLRVRVRWRHVAGCATVAAASVWLGGATAAYLVVKYKQGFAGVEYSHMLLYPWRKAEHRLARGEYWIERGKARMEAGELREAFYDLRLGSLHSPANRDARLLLAQFYVLWRRPEQAQATLIEGLDYHRGDVEYMRAILAFLLERQEDAIVLTLTEAWFAKAGAESAELRDLVAMARATAQFFRGNYDAAEETILSHRLHLIPDGRILLLRVEWERGDREVALERLRALTEELPENEEIYAQYASYLRETGRDDELRRLCILRRLTYPDQAGPRVDLLYLHHKAGDEAAVRADTAELRAEFSRDGQAMLALGDFAANTGRPELAREIYDHCRAHALPWEGPALMSVEAYLVAGRYAEALARVEAVMDENPEWGRRFAPVFNGLQAIAYYGLKQVEGAQVFLDGFLDKAVVRADNLVAVSNRLVAVGAAEQARQVLAKAVALDPLNQTALTGLIRLDVQLGYAERLPENVSRLLGMRKPSRPLLAEAFDVLASDRHLFAPGRAALFEALEKTLAGGS